MSWEDEKTLIVRIYGSALVEGTGLDFTGHSIFGTAEHAQAAVDRARLHALHIQPCGILMVRDVYDKTGRAHPCEFMTLPIAPDGAEIGRACGRERVCNA